MKTQVRQSRQPESHVIQNKAKVENQAPLNAILQRYQVTDKTGLPDNLKSGIENLSGYSMDDVRVHYNSSKPAQLQALAYTQGTDIHVAPGQEKYLPHEAWHVVQQKQGRVRPTVQTKGVRVNEDSSLEREADCYGSLVMNNNYPLLHLHSFQSCQNSPIVQMFRLVKPGVQNYHKGDDDDLFSTHKIIHTKNGDKNDESIKVSSDHIHRNIIIERNKILNKILKIENLVRELQFVFDTDENQVLNSIKKANSIFGRRKLKKSREKNMTLVKNRVSSLLMEEYGKYFSVIGKTADPQRPGKLLGEEIYDIGNTAYKIEIDDNETKELEERIYGIKTTKEVFTEENIKEIKDYSEEDIDSFLGRYTQIAIELGSKEIKEHIKTKDAKELESEINSILDDAKNKYEKEKYELTKTFHERMKNIYIDKPNNRLEVRNNSNDLYTDSQFKVDFLSSNVKFPLFVSKNNHFAINASYAEPKEVYMTDVSYEKTKSSKKEDCFITDLQKKSSYIKIDKFQLYKYIPVFKENKPCTNICDQIAHTFNEEISTNALLLAPWSSHYAGVLCKDGDDILSIENGARLTSLFKRGTRYIKKLFNKNEENEIHENVNQISEKLNKTWYFRMYGSEESGQDIKQQTESRFK